MKLRTRDLRCRHGSQAKVMALRRLARLGTSGGLWLRIWKFAGAGPGNRLRGMFDCE